MTDVTVPVPTERTAEFFQFFGLWLAGSLTLPFGAAEAPHDPSEGAGDVVTRPWGNTEADLEDATLLWKKFSVRARAMFSLLIDNPGREFTGEEIAEAANIPNGAHGVAGVLAWPGRHGYAIHRGLPSEFNEDPETLETSYKMSAKRAELFKAAREQGEASAA